MKTMAKLYFQAIILSIYIRQKKWYIFVQYYIIADPPCIIKLPRLASSTVGFI